MQLNASRIKVLQAQDDLVNSMKETASKELLHIGHHHHSYEHLLKDLIVQVGQVDSLIYCNSLLLLKINFIKVLSEPLVNCCKILLYISLMYE